jgi:hypothetical protein
MMESNRASRAWQSFPPGSGLVGQAGQGFVGGIQAGWEWRSLLLFLYQTPIPQFCGFQDAGSTISRSFTAGTPAKNFVRLKV